MKLTYKAPEIHCESCAGLIRDTLEDIPGVNGIAVDVQQKTVTVDYADAAPADLDPQQKVVQLLQEEGYTAQVV